MFHETFFDHNDLVTQDQRLIDAVGYEHDAGMFLLLDAEKLFLHLLSRKIIESGERLVHQDESRLIGKRPGDRRALLHAAGELGRVCFLEAGKIYRRDDVLNFGPIDLILFQPENNVLPDV